MPDYDEIKAIFEDVYPARARGRDPQAYAEMFTEEAIQMPPDVPDSYGPSDIAAGYAQQITDKDLAPSLTVEEIEVLGDYGYATGIALVKVHPHDGTPSIELKFRGFWLMKKVQGIWKIHRQIWNEKP